MLRRARERLASFLTAWIDVQSLPANPNRKGILAGMNLGDRATVESVVAKVFGGK